MVPDRDQSSVKPPHSRRRSNQTDPPLSFDLLRVPLLGKLLTMKHARTLLQIPLFVISGAMILHGLFGPVLAPKNIATTFTWVHFRGALVFVLLLPETSFASHVRSCWCEISHASSFIRFETGPGSCAINGSLRDCLSLCSLCMSGGICGLLRGGPPG